MCVCVYIYMHIHTGISARALGGLLTNEKERMWPEGHETFSLASLCSRGSRPWLSCDWAEHSQQRLGSSIPTMEKN